MIFLEALTDEQKIWFHITISWLIFFCWIFFSFLGYYLNKNKYHTNYIKKISLFLISFSIIQEVLDYLNRIFLDPNYTISWQRDLPFHFCHIALYFSLIAMYFKFRSISTNQDKASSKNQFLFEAAFLLGLSGALQGIFTPDFKNIHNFIGILCGQLQHSLIILNVLWLIFACKMKLTFRGVIYTYLFTIIIIPIALFVNYILGSNTNGDAANYLYVIELPEVDNTLLNLINQYPYPDYILYIQPIIIVYLLVLYLPFFAFSYYKKTNYS